MTEIETALERLGGDKVFSPLSENQKLEIIPTGIKTIDDDVLACGGLPRGRIVHIFAETSVGKTTFSQFISGKVQLSGGNVAWGEAEGTLMADYSASSGMKIKDVWMIEHTSGNDLLYKTQQLIALNLFDLIVLDSLDAIRPSRTLEHNEELKMNERMDHPKLLNDFFYAITSGFSIKDANRKMIINPYSNWQYNDKGKLAETNEVHKLKDKKTILIIISHKKVKIGQQWGSKTRTSGGGEKDFAATIQLDLRHVSFKKGKSKKQTVLRFREVKVVAVKNKVGIPQGEAILRIYPDGKILPPNEDDLTDVQELTIEEAEAAGLEISEEARVAEFKTRFKSFKEGKNEDERREDPNSETVQEEGA